MIPVFNVIEAATGDNLWLSALRQVLSCSPTIQPSRAGGTQELLHAALVLHNPRERWVVSRQPAINPAFAIAELIWILQGRNDAAFLNYFNPGLPKFAGTGTTYHGAYGHRLRTAFGIDQLRRGYETLSSTPASRQVVLQIWNSSWDMPQPDGSPIAPDIPCNINSLLKVRNGHLHWTQILRSNDLHLGLPYNLIQFTTLHEIMAGWLNLELGPYLHIADSLHIYCDTIDIVGSSTKIDSPENIDRLGASFAQTESYLENMELLIEAIIEEATDARALCLHLEAIDLPIAWRNMATLLVAEACRKRSDPDLSKKVLHTCTSSLLQQVATRWFARCEQT
jgi:thymidylate synthase